MIEVWCHDHMIAFASGTPKIVGFKAQPKKKKTSMTLTYN